jgi:hypothetical protein
MRTKEIKEKICICGHPIFFHYHINPKKNLKICVDCSCNKFQDEEIKFEKVVEWDLIDRLAVFFWIIVIAVAGIYLSKFHEITFSNNWATFFWGLFTSFYFLLGFINLYFNFKERKVYYRRIK